MSHSRTAVRHRRSCHGCLNRGRRGWRLLRRIQNKSQVFFPLDTLWAHWKTLQPSVSMFTCRTTFRCRLIPLVVVSSSSRLPSLSCWVRTIVVIRLFDFGAVLHYRWIVYITKCLFSEKEPQHACTLTPWRFVHVSEWLTLKMRWWTYRITDFIFLNIEFAHLSSVHHHFLLLKWSSRNFLPDSVELVWVFYAPRKPAKIVLIWFCVVCRKYE